jgi:hypothetical protein
VGKRFLDAFRRDEAGQQAGFADDNLVTSMMSDDIIDRMSYVTFPAMERSVVLSLSPCLLNLVAPGMMYD